MPQPFLAADLLADGGIVVSRDLESSWQLPGTPFGPPRRSARSQRALHGPVIEGRSYGERCRCRLFALFLAG
jgi:hypothetical protein